MLSNLLLPAGLSRCSHRWWQKQAELNIWISSTAQGIPQEGIQGTMQQLWRLSWTAKSSDVPVAAVILRLVNTLSV